MTPRVLDATAIVALFGADERQYIFELWKRADRDELTLVLPSAALAEATHLLSIDDNAWEALLMAPGLAVATLGQGPAIGSARQPGTLVVRQVVYEALAVQGVVVTRAPWQYVPGAVPLRVI